MCRPREQTRREPGAPLKLRFEPAHLPSVGLVIVSQEVEEPVEGQNAPFCDLGMPKMPGLAGGNPPGDGDVPERRNRRKRQHIRGLVDVAVRPIQPADVAVGQDRDRHLTPGAPRRHAGQPRAKSARRERPSTSVGDGDPQARQGPYDCFTRLEYDSYALTICCTS